jgi:hypothetical protein
MNFNGLRSCRWGNATVLRRANQQSEGSIQGRLRPVSLLSFPCSLIFLLCLIGASCNQSAALAGNASPAESQEEPDSGIYGVMVAAWGNAPANPPTYECIRIFDSTGQRLIATGVCSGTYAQFRIPLPPGRYLVDRSLLKSQPGVPPKAHPGSLTVNVSRKQWVNLAPKQPPGPIP